MARPAAGSRGQADNLEQVAREWARASCEAQGVAVKITERRILDDVARLLVESAELRE